MAWIACQTKLSYKYRRRTHTVTPALEESYLRVDISCGSEACDSCRVGFSMPDAVNFPSSSSFTAASPAAIVTSSLSASAPYYLIPDEVTLSELLELLELPDISNYIILSSCLKQVALKSGRKATRLRALYRDRRRRAVLFDDLHCLDTSMAAAGTDPSLPPVLAAGLYYSRHLAGRVPLVVVSDQLAAWMAAMAAAGGAMDGAVEGEGDGGMLAGGLDYSALADHLAEAAAAGLTVLSAAEYVGRFWSPGSAVAQLYDSLTAAAKAAAGGGGGAEGDASYAPHLSQQEVEEGLAAGELVRGVVHVSRRSPTEAVVELGHGPDTALGRLVRLSGRSAINRAMEGDVVAVRLLLPGGPAPDNDAAAASPGDAAAAATDADYAAAGGATAAADTDYGAELLADAEGNTAGGEEGALAMMEAAGAGPLPAAQVVAILQRDPRDIVACLSQRDEAALRARLDPSQPQSSQQQQQQTAQLQRRTEVLVCLPLDRRLPPVVVVTRQAGQLLGSRFVVRVDSWERNSRYPRGHVTRVLGRLNDLRAESEAVLVQCGIHYKPFCEAALAELPRLASPADWRVSAEERAARRDLTGPEYFVVSIDPVGCTDVDDAMHVRFLPPAPAASVPRRTGPRFEAREPQPDPQQRVEVGVHIADVSWFVAAGGMLDGEARDRCTSVYLVDRRLDMLPGLLSEQLCSLREGVERFAVSVIWTLRRRQRQGQQEGQEQQELYEYEVEDVWFGRTLIRSRHQLHYQQAQDILDGRAPAPGDQLPADHIATLRPALRVLDELAGQLHARRVAAGALELASAELRFKVDEVTGAPCQVVCKQKIPMMDVVAEMMIAANSAVAERIARAYPGCALLRNHPPPRAQAFDQIRALLEPHTGGTPVDPASNASLAAALERACAAAAAADPAAATLIKSLATRAMSEAQYNSSGTTPPGTPLSYHYGLALQYYTHFTSPIRRYADVVVHRQLLAALAGAPPPLLHPDLAAAAHTMNVRHRQAKAAQKECSELYLLLLLHARPHVERALVCGISGNRLELFVPSYQLRGAVALTDRRGLPRPPLVAGQPEGQEAEDDVFAAAERRHLRLTTTPDSATITDTTSGALVWAVRLWQPVSVRLCAADHRAHGPKLAMRLLDPSHPDALPLAAVTTTTAVAAPLHAPRISLPAAAAAQGPAPEGASAATTTGTAAAAALPPHLRLLIGLREKEAAKQQQQQQQLLHQQKSGEQPQALIHGQGQSTAATAAAGLDGGMQGGNLQAPASQAPAGAGHELADVHAKEQPPPPGFSAGACAAKPGQSPLECASAPLVTGDDMNEGAVLVAPAEALVAAGPSGTALVVAPAPEFGRAFRSDMACSTEEGVSGLGDGGSVSGRKVEPGERLLEVRSQLRRVARLEMRLLACRRGSKQELKILERLDELRENARHMQA